MTSEQRNGAVYAQGHELCLDQDGGRVVVKAGITFVDAANDRDAAQDGTAEHPYSRIRDAVERAGADAVIFVRAGRYGEAVKLKPGQTLTSAVDLEGGREFAETEKPLLSPGAGEMVHGRCWEANSFEAALVLPGNASARGLEIRIAAGDSGERQGETAAVAAVPENGAGADETIAVSDCRIRAEGTARGMFLYLPREAALGAFRITGTEVNTDAAKGITAVLDASSRAEIEFEGNTVATREEGAFAVNVVVMEKAALSLMARKNSLSTEGEEAEALRVRLSGLEIGLSGEVSGNSIRTGGTGAAGLSVHFDGETRIDDNKLVVKENTIEVRGDMACGAIVRLHDKAALAGLDLLDNTFNAAGSNGCSVWVWTRASGLRALNARGNTINATGGAAGLRVEVEDGAAGMESCTVAENKVAVGHAAKAAGIALFLKGGAVLPRLECQGNEVTTEGDGAKALLCGVREQARLGEADISRNTLDTAGNKAAGLWLGLKGGVLDSLSLTDNVVNTRGGDSPGMSLVLMEGKAGEQTLTGNRIACGGDKSPGIVLFAERSAALDIRGNTIEVSGTGSDGLFLLGIGRKSERWVQAGDLERTNDISVQGEGGKKVELLETGSGGPSAGM